ncbi:MAG: phosphotransferase [Firmicutes bacterium]|nr:phosphotransferase [Bacillota bacterium]
MNQRKSYRPPSASRLEKLGLKREWLAPWDLAIESVERIGDRLWRLRSHRGEKLLRRVDWDEDRARFICRCMDHLGRNGLRSIPRFIRTSDGQRWVPTGDGCLYLCDFLERRPLDIKRPEEMQRVFRELSRVHHLLKDLPIEYQGPPGRSAQPWSQQWEEDRRILIGHLDRAETEPVKTTLDSVFLEESDQVVNQIDRACGRLWETDYEYLRGDYSHTVCHGNFKESNLFWTPANELYIDRFDGCHHNLRVYDLGRFLYRVLSECGWDPVIGAGALEAYQELEPIDKEENKILAAFLSYPHPAVAYIRAYYERREGCNPYELANGIRRELMRLKSKERFLDLLTPGKA